MTKCLICNNEKLNEMNLNLTGSVTSDCSYIPHPISHLYCNKCGYIFIEPLNKIDVEKFYTNNYEFLTNSEEEEPVIIDAQKQIKYSDNLISVFSEFIENDSNKTFFDIGAGKGNFIDAIYHSFPSLSLYALEPSKSFELLKKKKFLKEYYNKFFNSKDFYGKSFNYLSIIGVLEHVVNPKEFLENVSKIMNENSYLFIEVPNFYNNKSDLLCADHLSKFTPESICNLFNSTGFKVLKNYIPDAVNMQFVIQKTNKTDKIIDFNVKPLVDEAEIYLEKVLADAKSLNENFAIYGQGIIGTYCIMSEAFDKENLKVLIDDNKLYQGKKWNQVCNIVSFEQFNREYDVPNVFLAMNDCYHDKVLKKLQNYNVYGKTR